MHSFCDIPEVTLPVCDLPDVVMLHSSLELYQDWSWTYPVCTLPGCCFMPYDESYMLIIFTVVLVNICF